MQVGPWVTGAVLAVGVGAVVLYFLPAAPLAPVAVVEAPTAFAQPVVAADAGPAPEPAAIVEQIPTFDTFRVDPDGTLVVAGRAAPGQVVELMLAGEVLARVMADGSGSFVVLSTTGESDMPRRLSLLADPDGAAVPSQTSYMVAPIVVADAGLEPAQSPDIPPVLGGDMPALDQTELAVLTPQAPTETAAPIIPEPASAPVVLQADADGVRVLQGGADLEAPNVALDAITYDPDGEVQLAGRATGEGAVQVYLDNKPVSTSPVTAGRDWRIDLPNIDTGVYTLRIDEVDTAGDVVSRLETPFKREEAASVAAVLAEETAQEGFEVAVRTVQPGSTLWAIAEENLGNGIFYVQVFDANRDLIRDPDLIYPGQIFRIPQISQ